MKNIISFNDLCSLAKLRKCLVYWYSIKQYQQAFTGNFDIDIKTANNIIDKIINNNTAHGTVSMFRWAYDRFYGINFNHKFLHQRSASISKFTTRLDINQIQTLFYKLKEYVAASGLIDNNYLIRDLAKQSRLKLLHTFNILVSTGMRLGEFTAIDFTNQVIKREIVSPITNSTFYEIVINTEKTNKNREVFIPKESFEFFQNKPKNHYNTIGYDFRMFTKWAKLPFKLTPHVCRRTLASIMHEGGIDLDTIAIVLGNTPKVVQQHYILSSRRNFDACEIASAFMHGKINKSNNMFINSNWMDLNKQEPEGFNIKSKILH